MVDEAVRRISRELARVEQGNLRAFADEDRVILVIQDAPNELRKLADALEKVNINEIQALVAYTMPQHRQVDRPRAPALPAPHRDARAASVPDGPGSEI
ncbi:MAG: hypothetical protein KatS3mg102_1994 [Planctomycetota bacterium]|nr:MAG: hypothetical protein KatS3mg102_1994 [Planctomycetota bacterium]